MGSLHCRGVVVRRDTAHRKLKLIVMNQRFGDKRMHKGPREWGAWKFERNVGQTEDDPLE